MSGKVSGQKCEYIRKKTNARRRKINLFIKLDFFFARFSMVAEQLELWGKDTLDTEQKSGREQMVYENS